jgi:hypothetical protein
MDSDTHSDFQWLTSTAAEEHLQVAIRLFRKNLNPLKTAKLLRKSISPSRAAVVMEQAQLRLRGRRKFEHADSMFFTGKGLEQSSSTLIADYKVKRFAEDRRVVDICCGIGGDLISLARRSENETFETVGVEKDEVAAGLAAANLRALKLPHASVQCSTFESFDIAPFDAIHLDPDRRTKGRTTKGNFFEPSLDSILERIEPGRQRVAIKVAPATKFEVGDIPVEREWIGGWRECKQQVLWMGPAVTEGSRTATIIAKDGQSCHFRFLDSEEKPGPPKMAKQIGPYIYEPHASLLAAGLGEKIAAKYSLEYLARGVAYMNSDQLLNEAEPMLKGYRVDHVLAVDLKQIQKKLNKLGIGQLVIKKRGVDQVLADKVSRLKLSGDEKATVILTRHDRARRAVIVTRVVS